MYRFFEGCSEGPQSASEVQQGRLGIQPPFWSGERATQTGMHPDDEAVGRE